MSKKILITLCVIASYCLFSCNNRPKENSENSPSDSTLLVKYAHGFSVEYADDYKKVTIFDPWKAGETQKRYYLVKTIETPIPSDGVKVQIPLKTVATTSCTHYAFLGALGQIEAITAICNPELAYNDSVQKLFAEGKIASLGDATNLNLERLIATHPSALLVSSYGSRDANTDRLQSSQIPLIFINEWTETSALARAEWLKLVACFFDQEAAATTAFDSIESNYIDATILAQMADNQPTVLAGGNFKGTWYMPSGGSYMGQLIADAHTNYFYKENKTNESMPLSFETVLYNFANADVWINAPYKSMKALFEADSRYRLFAAAKNGQVYGFHARTTDSGANDFWESGVLQPDRILRDLIWAIHPEMSRDYTPTYILKLEE